MKILLNLCSVLYVLVTFAHGLGSLTFPMKNIVEVLQAESYSEINEICAKHLELFATEILNGKIWALQMADSIVKFPDGIFLGRTYFPGHFDECVEVTPDEFQGKYCMTHLNFALNNNNNLKASIPAALANLTLHLGLCVPSSCSAKDIQNAIKNVKEINSATVDENECSTQGYRPFRTEDWICVSVIAGLITMALLSTGYDLYQKFVKKTVNPSQLWTSFSIFKNGNQLFQISQNSTQLKCLHGIRFLSMSWVILAHSYFTYSMFTAVNMKDVLKVMNDKSFTPVSNGFVSVDSFLFLSGLLVCLVFFRDISKKGSYDVPVVFLHRYIRLTPPFAILILIQATIISRIGNGPFWNVSADSVEKNCREGWWSGLLYVQNYVNPSDMCLGQAWYLSADMQMYWISPLILYPLLWFPSFAPFLLGILVLAASLTNFAIAYVNKLQPNLLLHLEISIMDQFKLEYAPFHTRMAPWIIGLATGYVICGVQAKKINIRLSKYWTLCGWLTSLGLLGGTLFGIVRFIPGKIPGSDIDDFTTAEAALYLAFHRVGWALGLAWVVIACVSGHGGLINNFLSMDVFQPLAKLSYCNFLIHMTLQNYRSNSLRMNPYFRHFEVVYTYFGDLIISHLISIPIVLLFEFPFTNLDRHFLRKLVIFPFPRKKLPEEKMQTEKAEKFEAISEDVEKGKTNPAFDES